MAVSLRGIMSDLYHLPCSLLRGITRYGGIQCAFVKQNRLFAYAHNKLTHPCSPSGNLKSVAVQHNPKFSFNRALLRTTVSAIPVNVATVQTNNNGLRTGAARLFMSIVFCCLCREWH